MSQVVSQPCTFYVIPTILTVMNRSWVANLAIFQRRRHFLRYCYFYANLRRSEEDLGSEVVFRKGVAWSIDFGPHWFLFPLTFMTTQLLQLSLGQFDVLQDLGSEVVFWFVVQPQARSTLPIPFQTH